MLYLKKHSVKEIRETLELNNERIVRYWIVKHQWDLLLTHETVEQAISRRICLLAERDNKKPDQLAEMDRLINQLDKLAGIEQKKAKAIQLKKGMAAGNDGGGGGKNKKERSKKVKNDVSGITAEQLATIRKELFYEYQNTWHDAKSYRMRFILKSRQIGATFYFAWEAFEDAVLTGDNQIFLSASKDQANIFKAYIIGFAKDYFDIELKGDVIVLSNGAELRFLSTNARTAQGYHGHLYVDEVFWMQSFAKVNEVASGIASQKKWRTTYFSTPSMESHSAYPLWTGEWFNKARKRKKKIEIPLDHETLKDGLLCADGIWRNMVTVVDAEAKGCDLFDIAQLRNERPDAVFRNLFMCEFRREGDGVFTLDKLLACGVDSYEKWKDFNKALARPFDNTPVWAGYDPARKGDKSIFCVVAPPLDAGGKFRVLEWFNLMGSYASQASRIKEITQRYNIQYMGIDVTGPGGGVFEMVKRYYPRATPIHYGMNTKTQLVLKAQDVIEGGRIAWDAGEQSIPQSFMQIRQIVTNSDQITYAADRTADLGHADVAWSIMHAIHNEPLSGPQRKSRVG